MLRRTILISNQRRAATSCRAALIDARLHSLDDKNDEPSLASSSARRQNYQSQSLRSFHSTRRNEILPLIAAGAVVGIGVYSVKALRRMDEDWDEYQWQLEQYEKQLARTNPTEQVSKAMAIDLGSVYCKLATSHPQPSVVVSREGDRAFFNGIVNDGTHVIRGRAALERFYYATEGDEASLVQMPWISLTESNAGEVVYEAVSPAIKEAIEMLDYRNIKTDEPLRKIVTVPVHFQDPFVDAFGNVLPDNQATFLPNPVAAIWGAQTRGILPTDDEKIKKAKTFLVVDVGGMVTQISIVQKDIVLGSLSIPWGGETYIQILVELLLKDAPIELHDARSLSALQTQARLAIMELSNKTRAAIHVPYLFPDPKNHHLDTTMSRIVVEQAMNEHVNKDLAVDFGDLRVLSPHMPVPTTVSSLFQSLVTQVLEEGRKMPAEIDHVLVVGGGSKTHQVQDAVSSTLAMLMGGDGPKKLAIPDSVLQTELTVLGAATMLPSYEYHIDSGLRRIDSE